MRRWEQTHIRHHFSAANINSEAKKKLSLLFDFPPQLKQNVPASSTIYYGVFTSQYQQFMLPCSIVYHIQGNINNKILTPAENALNGRGLHGYLFI